MQRVTELHASQLFNACHVLFGPEIDVSLDFLRYLQMPGLKAVYRKKALETHPDRAVALTLPQVILEEQFKRVNAAYQELHHYLANPLQFKLIDDNHRKQPHPTSRKHAWAESKSGPSYAHPDRFRRHCIKGVAPKRSLLLGQYIYHIGYISYRQLIEAIIWQRMQRPLIGKIAVHCKWLRKEEVKEILAKRRLGEKFGESALRNGYLSQEDVHILLRRQRLLQPRIGKYFVEKKILPHSLVEKLVERARLHNRLYRS